MKPAIFRSKLSVIDKTIETLRDQRKKLILTQQTICKHLDIAYFCEPRCTGEGYNNGYLCMDCGAEHFGWTAYSDSAFGRTVSESDCREERITHKQFFELGVRG